jgi:hypothetical protein
MNMDYKELEKLVITGHDIEFEYDNNKYSIVKSPEGFQFSDIQNKEDLKTYSSAMQLLIKASINGKKLNDISKDMKNIRVY